MSVTITRNPNLTKARQSKDFASEVQSLYKDKWWTGLAPEICPGFDEERQCLVALPLLNLEICSRDDIRDYFNNSWTLTELLFQGLKTEDAFLRPPYHGLRHPLMFYYGHPAVLYLNKMRIAGFFSEPINLYLEKVLETGVDEMSWDDMNKNEMEWPHLEAVHNYRKLVYKLVLKMIDEHPDLDRVDRKASFLQNSPWWSLWMGIEHEKIHFETSSVLIRELPIELVETPKYWAPMHPSKNSNNNIENTWVKQNGQTVQIGKSKLTPSFGWDNEYGERKVLISDFQFLKYQTSNRDYFDFVSSGAYINDQYWSDEGLLWRKFRNTKRPSFWCATGPEGSHEYELRTIFEIISMPWNWPVEVNFHEAQAYIRWKNTLDKKKEKSKLHYRLLTEAEYHLLRNSDGDEVLQKGHYSKKNRETIKSNFNFHWSTPENINSEIAGNVWHWVEDQFNPLSDFQVHPLYDDFSTPCFDGKHNMILGGSFISTGHEASQFARFHFRPHFNQHSGFRIAATLDGSPDNQAIKILKSNEYIHPHRENALDQINKNEDWWKNIDQPLEMKSDELKNLFDQTQNSVLDFMKNFENLSPMGLAHDPKINGLKKDFILPYQMTKNFPERPESYHSLLKLIFNEMAPLSQLPGHPGFAAYVAGCGNAISNSAQFIAQTLNPFTGHYMMAPGLVALEQEVIKWFINLMGYSEKSSLGYLTTGGSAASMNALMLARLNKISNHDYSLVTGYVSSEAHHCIAKSWVLLGFKKENLRIINTINNKIDIEALTKQISTDRKNQFIPFFLVGTVGTTKTGSIDQIDRLADLAEENQLWLHADGAYGALFMLTEKGKNLLKGINRADSIALDPHKALSIPYGTGCLLVKNGSCMNYDYISDDSYMPPAPSLGEHDYADISPELSRDYRGLRVWLPIKTLGIGPFILNLEEKLKLSEWTYNEILKNKKLVIHSAPELTILTFGHINGDAATKKLLEMINQKETLFLSSCIINNKFSIRICLLGYKLHFARLEKAITEIFEMADQC